MQRHHQWVISETHTMCDVSVQHMHMQAVTNVGCVEGQNKAAETLKNYLLITAVYTAVSVQALVRLNWLCTQFTTAKQCMLNDILCLMIDCNKQWVI